MTTECKASSSEEPGAGIPHAGICAGGARQRASLPRYLTLFNSTLTLQQAGTVNGDLFIDLGALPESGAALVAQGDLALGSSATLHLSGTPVDGQILITCDGELSGRLTLSGLPGAYTLAYGAEGPGTVSLIHSPTVLLVR